MTDQPSNPTPSQKPANLLRAIDANLNRAREAFRAIEDCCRFLFNERLLTKRCKALRHELSDWSKSFQTADLIFMRDSAGDIGRHSQQASEYVRKDTQHLLKANFSRAQQALRALEEFSKTIDGDLAKSAEAIRYQTYGLERAVFVAYFSNDRLKDANLYVLLEGGTDELVFAERIKSLVAAKVDVIQLRDKSLDDQALLQRAKLLVESTRGTSTLAIINDRVDLAVAAGADGVHLGQDDIPPAEARQIVGPRMLIGLSTHSIEQARAAEQMPVNYIGVGPTFPSNTKSFEAFTGTDLLRKVADEISLPAFAIGGINDSNIDQVIDAGIHRAAVSGAIDYSDHNSIQTSGQALKAMLAEAGTE